VYREDEIDASRILTQDQVLANAPAKHNGMVKVPAIFEE
jgi:Asp-tRNA(Asn)/Glu-tRNA(Gln) amidotransferase C subunit